MAQLGGRPGALGLKQVPDACLATRTGMGEAPMESALNGLRIILYGSRQQRTQGDYYVGMGV